MDGPREPESPDNLGAQPHDERRGRDRAFLPVAYVVAGLTTLLTITLSITWIHRWSRPAHNDFAVFYAAGKLAARGRLASAYLGKPLYLREAALAHAHALRLPFPYPPAVAAVFVPLAHLPFWDAYVVWTALNLLAYVIAGALILRHLEQSRQRILAVLAMAGCLPLLISTVQGENSGILALGAVLCLEAFEIPWLILPGIALLSFKPQLLLIPLVLVVVRHRRVEIVPAAVGLVLVGLLGLIAGGITGYRSFITLLLHTMHWTTQYHWGALFNYSLLAQLRAYLGYGLVSTALWILLGAGILALWLTRRTDPDVDWLPAACLIVLLSNHLLFHDLTILYPAAAIALFSRLRWVALLVLLGPWLDPVIYRATSLHLVVIGCLAVIAAAISLPLQAGDRVRRIESQTLGDKGTVWKLFERAPWASASESRTRSRSYES